MFEILTSGYYDFIKRMNTPVKDLPLIEKIEECQQKFSKTHGYRRVHKWLKRENIYYNSKTMLCIMQRYNLLSMVRRRKYHYYSQALHKHHNLLNRNFKDEHLNPK